MNTEELKAAKKFKEDVLAMEMNFTVVEQGDGMVAVSKENGDVFILKKEVYELATSLMGIFKKTDPRILEVSMKHLAAREDEQSKFLLDATALYLKEFSN